MTSSRAWAPMSSSTTAVTDFAAHVDGMDVVLDTIGGDTARRPSAYCAPAACW